MVTRYPENIVSGQTFFLRQEDRNFSAITVAVRGPSVANGDATNNNGVWELSLDSTAWAGGNYLFEVWATDSATGAKRCLGQFPLTVTASIMTQGAGFDPRSAAKRNVDALQAYLGQIGVSDQDQTVLKYRINNRELENYPISEIRSLLRYWQLIAIRERRTAMGLLTPGPSIKARI